VNGYSDLRFGVYDAITRGQISKVISQTLEYVEILGTYNPPDPFSVYNEEVILEDRETTIYTSYDVIDGVAIEPIYDITTGQDSDKQAQIWAHFVDLIPLSIRLEITGFDVFTDGVDNYLAAVYRNFNDVNTWIYAVDINDYYIGDVFDEFTADYGAIHEASHILSLNNSQIDFAYEAFTAQTEDEFEQLYYQAIEDCVRYFPTYGCAKEDSYINAYFNNFWTDRYAEWLDIISIEDDQARLDEIFVFYEKYSSEFVTSYAATHPDEDFAESFTYFVMFDRPDVISTKAREKVEFFYGYPELVSMRDEIRSKL
jgi:hypothetical protein